MTIILQADTAENETNPSFTLEDQILSVGKIVYDLNRKYKIPPATGLEIVRFSTAWLETQALRAARAAQGDTE